MQKKITSDGLMEHYGIPIGSVEEVLTSNSKRNIHYIRNPKHDPTIMPPQTSAWVAVHHTECDLLVSESASLP